VSGSLRATARLAALVLWTALTTPAFVLAKLVSRRLARLVLGSWHRGALAIAGVRLITRGEPCGNPGTLLVANHVSYLDIPVLGALAGVDFVAKAEIAGWPVMGAIGRLIDTLYVERRVSASATARDALAGRLSDGGRLAMFPEGTTTDGRRVLPFRSAPFAALEATPQACVQPVTLRYAALDGLPIDRERRWQVAWCGEAELVPHLWALLASGAIVAEVEFHAPIPAGAADRKQLAQRCHAAVAGGLARRLPPLWWLGDAAPVDEQTVPPYELSAEPSA
jgi:1-acyl-sn-glycerol-3-phosphate acyltransferase